MSLIDSITGSIDFGSFISKKKKDYVLNLLNSKREEIKNIVSEEFDNLGKKSNLDTEDIKYIIYRDKNGRLIITGFKSEDVSVQVSDDAIKNERYCKYTIDELIELLIGFANENSDKL